MSGPAGHDPWSRPAPGPAGADPWASPTAWWDPSGRPPPPPPGATGPGGGQWVPPAPRRRGAGRTVGLGAGVLALALVGGFLGAALHSATERPGTSSTATLPLPPAGSTERAASSTAAIAARTVPSVVALQVVGADGAGTGSGFVIQVDGAAAGSYVLTNDHVVAGADRDGIAVVLEDGTQLPGELVGADASYDLAVVRVEREGLRPLALGDSDAVVVGDPVVAVGAPLGLQGTVTEGIVSALNRPVTAGADADEASYIQAVQTDAAINPGNSGGPLLNAAGEVVGVNSAIAGLPGAEQTTGSIGLGFAIPSQQARRTAEQLVRTGRAVHPVIGVQLDGRWEGEGVLVSEAPDALTPGGAAESAGLRPGDVVLAVDGRPVTDPSELIVAVRAREPGETVTITLRRDEQQLDVDVTLQADG